MCLVRHRPRDSLATFGSKRFVTIRVVTRGGGSRQTVTNGDKGGGVVKNRDFYGDILSNCPICLT